jgi:hypothetical protein
MKVRSSTGFAVRIVRDTVSDRWAIKCAAECSECRLWRTMSIPNADGLPRVCWLTSAGTEQGARDLARKHGWTIEGMEGAA